MSGHTPGPWEAAISTHNEPLPFWRNRVTVMATSVGVGPGRGRFVALLGDADDEKEREANEADARLIAAAPTGLAAAERVYLALLRLPLDTWWLRLQRELCALRDFIAEATGRSPQDVQESFERLATGDYEWAEAHQDIECMCGHVGWLHDDGLAACLDCPCPSHRPLVASEVRP